MLTIGLLGPLQVSVCGEPVRATSSSLRTLLVVIALEAGSPVPVDRLVAALWDGDLPEHPRRTVQTHLTRLRQLLGAEYFSTGSGGYELRVTEDNVDALRFLRLLKTAGDAAHPSLERADLNAALGLWRGYPFDDLSSQWAVRTREGLVERYLAAVERLADLDIAEGRYGEMIPRLQELARLHPLRESLWVRLLTALNLGGRQAEALAHFERVRRHLADELGTDPGPELQLVYADLLAGSSPRTADEVDRRVASQPARVVPAQLPADIPGFTGRADHLERLDTVLPEIDGVAAAERSAVVTMVAIGGAAGVGKTALAVHWAHRVADRFPEGQLYLNLHGYGPGAPLEPLRALAVQLLGLGVEPARIPADTETAAGLYRSLLVGQRILVVLDNVRDAEQIRALLPGSPTCVVLITSRDRLIGMVATHGVHQLTMDMLSPKESIDLLSWVLGRGRVAAESEAAAGLAQVCGFLPLALRIAAANLTHRPEQLIADYVAGLRASDPLDDLAVDGDPQAAVRLAFDASYRQLPAEVRSLFRLLGIAPGTQISAAAAAALIGRDLRQTERMLRVLVAAHLLEPCGPHRFQFHDLLRMYARRQAKAEDGQLACDAAVERLLDWYLKVTGAAASQLHPTMLRLPTRQPDAPSPAEEFDQPADALAWLDIERPNLVAAVRHAAAHGPRPITWLLAVALRSYFWRRRHTIDWLTVAEAGLTAAKDAGDLHAQAAGELSLAAVHNAVNNYPEAIEHYTRALGFARQVGWIEAEASCLGNLGMVFWWLGDLSRAAAHHSEALRLDRENGLSAAEAANLINLGLVERDRGRLREAAGHCESALALYRKLGSQGGEELALGNLGEVERDLGLLDRALEHLSEAQVLQRKTGNLAAMADSTQTIAAVYADTGYQAQALERAEAAVALAVEIGDRSVEAGARNTLASVHLGGGRSDQAIRESQEALDLARRVGALVSVAGALTGLAAANHYTGRYLTALEHSHRALELASQSGFRVLEGNAHTVLAAAHRDLGRYDEAAQHARRALALHRQTGHRLGEARAQHVLGSIHQETGDTDIASQHCQQAIELFEAVGSPEVEDVRKLLVACRRTPHADVSQ